MFIFEQFIDFFINLQQNHSLKYEVRVKENTFTVFVKFNNFFKWNKCCDQYMICLNCHVYW